MRRTGVLYVGDKDGLEFVPAVRWLGEHVAVSFAEDACSAGSCVTMAEDPFDLIVVAERRPGEHAAADLDALRRAAPLTPMVFLLGSFCEGEARTGRPWPGAVRVYAHQFVARVGAMLERIEHDGLHSWTPPFTATDEDRLLESVPAATPDKPTSGLEARVVVVSKRREAAEALSDAIVAAGFQAVWQRDGLADGDKADIVVWDCPAGYRANTESLERITRRFATTPTVVILGFPRAEDTAAALAAGATAVISKPFLVEDLLWQLQACLAKHAETH